MPILKSEILALLSRLGAERFDVVIRSMIDNTISGATSAQSQSIAYLMQGALSIYGGSCTRF